MAKKSTDDMVAGMGLATSLITELTKAVYGRGGTPDDIHRLVTPDGEKLLGQLADLIVGHRQPTISIYSITSDRSKTIEQLVADGNYDGHVNPDITQENFPEGFHEGLGVGRYEVATLHFDRSITTAEVEAELDRLGYRASTMRELLAFGDQHADVQRLFPVTALGAVWTSPGGYRDVGYLYCRDGRRELNLRFGGPSYQWYAHCRFLVVRK